MDYVIAMFEHRIYVVTLVVTFIIVAIAERGWLRMFIWLITGTFIGWLVEVSSTRNGFPFGMYVYHVENFPEELWIMGIPLFASLSFAALTYFGKSLAYTLLSPLTKTSSGITRLDCMDRVVSVKLLMLAALLTSWTDLVIDPITRLGEYWWLGKLYYYDPEGIHFGIPLSNYFGWLFTTSLIIFINQRIDRFLLKKGIHHKPAFSLPHLPLWSFAYFMGNYIFLLCMNIVLINNNAVPDEEPVEWILGNSLLFMALWLIFSMSMLKRGLQKGRSFT